MCQAREKCARCSNHLCDKRLENEPTPKATGRIRIIKIPAGEAPLEVRRAWVGLELPCDPVCGYPDSGSEIGVVSKEPLRFNRYGYSVPQAEAIAILVRHAPAAAAWWRDHCFPRAEGTCFGFGEDEAEIISGVTLQKLTEVPDECMGDPDR
ncbi:MAG: hypothetical protein Q7S15_00405 [bacterium]|nr:hypothetical protein [bacterium]